MKPASPTPQAALKRRDTALNAAQSVALLNRLRDKGVPAAWLRRAGRDLIATGVSRRDIADQLKRILAKQGGLDT